MTGKVVDRFREERDLLRIQHETVRASKLLWYAFMSVDRALEKVLGPSLSHLKDKSEREEHFTREKARLVMGVKEKMIMEVQGAFLGEGCQGCEKKGCEKRRTL